MRKGHTPRGWIFRRLLSVPAAGGKRYFRISLSSRFRSYVAPLRLVLVGGCWLLLAGILWDASQAVIGAQESWRIQAELDRVRQQDQQLVSEAQQEGIELSESVMKQLPAEVALANHLLEKRMFSWTMFLTGLEQAIPPRLAISSIRLDAAGSVVHLTGTAMRLEDVTAFTVGLQDHPTFKDPVLAQHRVGTNGLVDFDVTVRYRREGV